MRFPCLLVLVVLFSSKLLAQTPIEQGQPAPESGIFLTKEQAAKIIAEKKAIEETCKINCDANIETQKTKCEYEKALLNTQLDYEKSKFDQINKLRDSQDEKLYDTIGDSGDNMSWFIGGIAAGVITTAALSVSIIIFVNQITQ